MRVLTRVQLSVKVKRSVDNVYYTGMVNEVNSDSR